MRKELLGLLLIGGLAGCTSQWDTDRAEASRSSPAAKAESAQTPAKLVAERGPQRSFASLPDRGELLQYAKDRKVRKSGAYTYHPVAISEAHALNAIAKGGMRINMPDGKTLDLKYDRHEEQPDGNWTWIGRNEDGSEAVLTFGDKAVFGMVSSAGQSYDVRTDRAGAWIVETNQALLAAGGGHGRRKEGPDYLAPPTPSASSGSGLVGTAAAASQKQAAISEKAAVNEKAAAVVDVLLGYSPGIVATIGSESGAQSRMASFVALTNVAYQASGVNMRVRLVHSMLVNYSDTGFKNDATLRKLTGYDETTQQNIPVDAAFTALRAAREQYGADLVALVRQYREPEQDGCGIAWLIGMNQRAISPATDAGFGYAVVGDGTDLDESDSRTYKCSQYALAHELGHLMGQAHNTEDSAGRSGAHTYSYGYREAASTGFFTIMAYPRDDTQAVNELGNFANPAVSAFGRPTGVANVSDNVLSMNMTMPTIALFRATVVPLDDEEFQSDFNGDFNADGRSDILWRHVANGQNVIWRSGTFATQTAVQTILDANWQVVGIGDFNGDGASDILWRHAVNGQNLIWRSGNFGTQSPVQTIPDTNWRVVGIGDFNGDGASDILWRHAVNGQNLIWRSGNFNTQSAVQTIPDTNWRVVGIGDFNGDGASDILWRHAVNGQNLIWRSGNFATQTTVQTIPDTNWRVAGVGDFNGDGASDILWRHALNGQNLIWRSGNFATQTTVQTIVDANWKVVGIGDFNGDGVSDVLWRHGLNGQNAIWFSGNISTQPAMQTITDTNWQAMPRR